MHSRFFPVTLFGWFKRPFQGLSDLHLGHQKVTWKKLVVIFLLVFVCGTRTPAEIHWVFFKLPVAWGATRFFCHGKLNNWRMKAHQVSPWQTFCLRGSKIVAPKCYEHFCPQEKRWACHHSLADRKYGMYSQHGRAWRDWVPRSDYLPEQSNNLPLTPQPLAQRDIKKVSYPYARRPRVV